MFLISFFGHKRLKQNLVKILLNAYEGGLEINRNFKQFRPSNDHLDNYYDYLINIWHLLLKNAPQFQDILSGKKKPGDIRKRLDQFGNTLLDDSGKPLAGGNVFARPIGQFIIAEVLKIALLQHYDVEAVIKVIMTNISMDIDEEPWVRVIWNPSTQRIQGTKSERTILSSMICHALGLKIRMKVSELKQKYRDTIEDPKAPLLKPIEWSQQRLESTVEEA